MKPFIAAWSSCNQWRQMRDVLANSELAPPSDWFIINWWSLLPVFMLSGQRLGGANPLFKRCWFNWTHTSMWWRQRKGAYLLFIRGERLLQAEQMEGREMDGSPKMKVFGPRLKVAKPFKHMKNTRPFQSSLVVKGFRKLSDGGHLEVITSVLHPQRNKHVSKVSARRVLQPVPLFL